uniref:Uncharacterized protein n=1 Tax=Romanomermis culicivorax TaxID=13658 RepID=A0A915JC48_ROMCU
MTSNGKRAINLHNRVEATASNKCATATTPMATPPTKVHSYPKFNLALEAVNSRTMPSMNRDQSMSRFTVAKVDTKDNGEQDNGKKANGIEHVPVWSTVALSESARAVRSTVALMCLEMQKTQTNSCMHRKPTFSFSKL